jgi:hypothetical protein
LWPFAFLLNSESIVDDWDAIGPAMRIDRRSTDWGLVALGIGDFFLIMAPIQLIFNDFYWSIGIHHADRQEIEIARVVGPLVGLAFLSTIGFGIFAAFRGMGYARTTRQSAALSIGGLLVCGLDIILWIGLTINLCAILGLIQ